jgi:Uncharacterized protein conserved in bacteria (DUF2059)
MTRGSVIAVLVGAMLGSSGIAAAATAERDRGDRVTGQPDHRAESRALDDLLQSSGLRVQLDSLTAGVRAQFLRAHRNQSSQDRLVIDRIVTERFSADILYSRIKAEFQRDLESGRLQTALAWYESPLGKRIIGQELAALVAPGSADAVADLEQHRPSARRIDLIERLDTGGGASETTVDVTVAIVRSLTVAFQPGLPAVAGLNRDQLDRQITTARNRTLENMRRICMVSMLLAYRGLSDDELEQYVQFVESDAGRWYMTVMNGALLTAVDAAAAATASELATAMPQLVRDLR